MFFLAGLLVAGLAGLLILPAFARRALRLSEARARMLAPLSMKDVIAERDLLRAEHALEQHRLERRVASLQDASAGHRADLGRQAASLVAFEARTDKLMSEIAAKERDILGLEGELGTSRIVAHDFSARLDRASAEIATLRERRLALETAADDHRTTIAGLETRASGLEMKLGDASQTAKSKAVAAEAETGRLSAELALRNGEVARLNAELRAALTKNATIIGNFEKKNGELERTRQRLVETEALAASRLQTLEAAAAENNRRRADSVARLSTPAGSDKDARRESDSNVQGDKALREAISQLAADVARLSEAPADASPRLPPGKIRNRDSRAPSSQGPDTADSVASANLRQLQPTAPER
jgi:predicted  nucleic acid-binding Zn-ribbon protein